MKQHFKRLAIGAAGFGAGWAYATFIGCHGS